jgi:hypothetical protein
MECSRRGEGNAYLSSPLPPVHEVEQHLTAESLVPGVSGEELPDLEELDTPMIPGYLTLASDLTALSEDSPGELPNNAASDEHCEKP